MLRKFQEEINALKNKLQKRKDGGGLKKKEKKLKKAQKPKVSLFGISGGLDRFFFSL